VWGKRGKRLALVSWLLVNGASDARQRAVITPPTHRRYGKSIDNVASVLTDPTKDEYKTVALSRDRFVLRPTGVSSLEIQK